MKAYLSLACKRKERNAYNYFQEGWGIWLKLPESRSCGVHAAVIKRASRGRGGRLEREGTPAMPSESLIHAQLLSNLCDLTLQEEFGAPLDQADRDHLEGLKRTARRILPTPIFREGLRFDVSQLGQSRSPSRPTILEVYRRALCCEGCPSARCPLALANQASARVLEKLH